MAFIGEDLSADVADWEPLRFVVAARVLLVLV
jgi:hypothetical protein